MPQWGFGLDPKENKVVEQRSYPIKESLSRRFIWPCGLQQEETGVREQPERWVW